MSAQGGADGNITLSTHENKDTGDFYAKFRYGSGVEITTGNITFNHYYTGFYVDYDGAQGFRMFTYDYKTDTLTQVPSANVVVTGTVGPMRAANFEVERHLMLVDIGMDEYHMLPRQHSDQVWLFPQIRKFSI